MYSITYLEDVEINDDEEEPKPEEALTKKEKREKIENDFYVSLARDVILSSKVPSREEALGQIQKEI